MRVGCVSLCTPGWAASAHRDLLPGSHAVALGPYTACIDARRVGFEVRDTILVLSAEGPRFAFLLRKPCSEATVAENVLKHGTGGLNINATRVSHASASDFEKHKAGVEAIKARGGQMEGSWKNSSDLSGASEVTMAGRWPSNLVLVHGPDCQREGVRSAGTGGRRINEKEDFQDGVHEGYKRKNRSMYTHNMVGQLRTYGLETIASWACEPGCPVAELDGMSGLLKSAIGQAAQQMTNKATVNFNGKAVSEPGRNQWGDSGGASRFFPQFESEDALRAWFERLIGLDPRKPKDDLSDLG